MAYKQSPINFGIGTGSSPLNKNGDPEEEKKNKKNEKNEIKSTDKSLEKVTYSVGEEGKGIDETKTTFGTTYYTLGGDTIKTHIDEGNLSDIKNARFRSPVAADRRFVTDSSTGQDLYLSPPHDRPGHPGSQAEIDKKNKNKNN